MASARRSARLSLIGRTLAFLAAAMIVAACGQGSDATGSTTPTLRVVATTTVFADIVRNVGGDLVTVDSIIPAGAGPEDFEPSPDDAVRLADADLIVSNGAGLDDFLDDLIRAAGGEDTPQLVLADGIPTITIDGEANPHFWLDPSLVTDHYLPAITRSLSELDPANADTYEANRAAYAAEIEAMDAENLVALEAIPTASRKLVTAHDAFPYFAEHYGFELVGVIVENVGQEPTAAELAALVETVKAAGVDAIFSESQFSPELAQALADEAGITNVVTTLYNDSVGPAPAETYLGMMRWNVQEIVKALA